MDLRKYNLAPRSPDFKLGILFSAWDCVIGPKTYIAWANDKDVAQPWLDAANMLLNSELCARRSLKNTLKHKVLLSKMQSYLCIYFSSTWMEQERNCALVLCVTCLDKDTTADAILADMQSPVLPALYDASMELSQLLEQVPYALGFIANWGLKKLTPIVNMMVELLACRKNQTSLSKEIISLDEFVRGANVGFLMTSLTAHLEADGFSVVIGKTRDEIEKHMTFLAIFSEDPVEPYWRVGVVDHQARLLPWIRLQGFLSGTQDYSCALGRQSVHIRGWRRCLAIHDLTRKQVYFSRKELSANSKTTLDVYEDSDDRDAPAVILTIIHPGQLRLPVRYEDQAKLVQHLVTHLIYADRSDIVKIVKWFRLKFHHLSISISSFLKDTAGESGELEQTNRTSVRELSKIFDMDQKCVRILLPAAMRLCYGVKVILSDIAGYS